MSLFILHPSNDFSKIGTAIPQVTTGHQPTDSFRGFIRNLEPPDSLIIPEFYLQYRAKWGDIFSSIIMGYPGSVLISEPFMQMIKEVRTAPFKAYPATVTDKRGNTKNFFVLIQYTYHDQAIDYERSRLAVLNNPVLQSYEEGWTYDYDYFKVSSFPELDDIIQNKRRGPSPIVYTELYLHEDAGLDSFIVPGARLWVVSASFAEKLQAAKIKGIALIPFQQGMNLINGTGNVPKPIQKRQKK